MPAWTADMIPPQSGKLAIVTGANTGIGFETARILARKGARVILACRNPQKAQQAVTRIIRGAPLAKVEPQVLDLSDLDAVRAFAHAFAAKHQHLHLLINNAGVMVPPFTRTK